MTKKGVLLRLLVWRPFEWPPLNVLGNFPCPQQLWFCLAVLFCKLLLTSLTLLHAPSLLSVAPYNNCKYHWLLPLLYWSDDGDGRQCFIVAGIYFCCCCIICCCLQKNNNIKSVNGIKWLFCWLLCLFVCLSVCLSFFNVVAARKRRSLGREAIRTVSSSSSSR